MKEDKKNGARIEGPNAQLMKAAAQGQFATVDQIKEYLQRDITGVYVLLAEILNSPEIIEVIAKVIFERYEKMRLAKEAQPEIFADPMNTRSPKTPE